MDTTALIDQLLAFLHRIGIETKTADLPSSTFLPGLDIASGTLLLDLSKLSHPGDILHEAGHIAISEKKLRATTSGNVITEDSARAGEELAVLLWSYASCVELGIDPKIVFHEDGYKGESEWILKQFRNKCYVGLPLLVWMQMTTEAEFPTMQKWLRD